MGKMKATTTTSAESFEILNEYRSLSGLVTAQLTAAHPRTPMRVLQVEDDPAAAQAVEQMMKAQGYVCQTTAYGEEAVELATDTSYDLNLLDIMLPDIDGYEVLRRLQVAGVKTPVLIQSGIIGREEMEKGVGIGAEDFLVKPFSRNELQERINGIMAQVDRFAKAVTREPSLNDRRGESRDDNVIRRNQPRVRTLKSGQIIYNNANCIADCLILDISEGGASLQATDVLDLPNHVTLKEQHGQS
jgi:DNA-binding response OmpR family regulator